MRVITKESLPNNYDTDLNKKLYENNIYIYLDMKIYTILK